MVIYKMVNTHNGKVYIGQTVRDVDVRMKEHFRHSTIVVDKAVQKYGVDAFEMGVLVDAYENPQMKCYSLGALAIYESLYDISEVSMSIFQPRRENVSTWTITVEELKTWAKEVLKPKAEMAMKGKGEYCPGEWCTFCRAEVRCRARAEEKLKLAQEEFKLPPLVMQE